MTYPLEDDEQIAFCLWLDKNGFDYFAIPTGGSRNKIEASKLKKTGVKSGVFDMFVFLPDKALFIEMKRVEKSLSSVSVDQKLFLKRLEKYPYCIGEICYGHQEAIQFVKNNIELM